MKEYVKALNIIRECFKYIPHAFPGLSEEKKASWYFQWIPNKAVAKRCKFCIVNDFNFSAVIKKFLVSKKLKAIKSFNMNCCLVLKQFVVK